MVPETLRLLTYTPLQALLVIANESLGTSFNPDNVKVEAVEALEGPLTRITLTAHYSGAKPINPSWVANPYEGQTTLLLNRLDLTDVFGDTFRLPIGTPTTVNDVIALIQSRTGIQFDEHDFAQASIYTPEHALVASPHSRRWVGTLHLVLTTD